MADYLKPETIVLFLLFTVPGIVVLYFRAQFTTGRLPPLAEGVIAYLTISLVYHALAFPIAKPLYVSGAISGCAWAGWIVLIFLAPALLGLLFGLNIRKGWMKKAINRLGISTIHPINSAWDWKFGQCEECWVMIVLKDGTKWYGFMGINSFMSSEPSERDIFIEKVYQMNKKGKPWTPRNSSVWIAHGEIQSLEFLPK